MSLSTITTIEVLTTRHLFRSVIMQQNQRFITNQCTLLSADVVNHSTLGWHDQMGQRIALYSRCFGNDKKLSPLTDMQLRDIGAPVDAVKPKATKRFWLF